MSSHKLPEVISRLSKIERHVRGIKKMEEEGRSCEELLMQVSAVKSAINNVWRVCNSSVGLLYSKECYLFV